MFVFAHAGIPLGIVWLGDRLRIRQAIRGQETNPGTASQDSALMPTEADTAPYPEKQRLLSIDYRVVLLGAMLPDIIDKPLGRMLLLDTFSNGRIFGHTLVFVLALTLTGVMLYARKGKLWLLILGCGSVVHLIQDQMWLTSDTLLWPFYGWAFERGEGTGDWLTEMWHALTHNPGVYLWEIAGAFILGALLLSLVRHHQVWLFIKRGRIYEYHGGEFLN